MKLRFRVGEKHPDGGYVKGDNADAHPEPNDPLYGTICFRTIEDAADMILVAHELAHIQEKELDGYGYGHGSLWWELYMNMLWGINPQEYAREMEMYKP